LAIRQTLAHEHPESPEFTSDLSLVLHNIAEIDLGAERFEKARTRLQQAVELERKALAVNPANPTYRRWLYDYQNHLIAIARALNDAEGLAEAERELATLRDSDPANVTLDARLPAIIKGDQQPTDEADRLALANRAYNKALHVTAARLLGEVLAVNPKLGDDRRALVRYNAACCAALAGCGQGNDDPPPDEAARTRLRNQALDWLRDELAAWSKVLESGAPQARTVVIRNLVHWQSDPDLAGLRDDAALAELPEEERTAFQQLWTDVDVLLARVKDSK
jgi:tetratricopeptide (TPR) repeat protein